MTKSRGAVRFSLDRRLARLNLDTAAPLLTGDLLAVVRALADAIDSTAGAAAPMPGAELPDDAADDGMTAEDRRFEQLLTLWRADPVAAQPAIDAWRLETK